MGIAPWVHTEPNLGALRQPGSPSALCVNASHIVAEPEMTMIRARVHEGRVEPEDPIPEEWEGQSVKIIPMTPDDP